MRRKEIMVKSKTRKMNNYIPREILSFKPKVRGDTAL